MLQRFDKAVYFLHFLRDADALGTMYGALSAVYTVVGLTKTRYTAIITHKESLPCAAVILILQTFGNIALVDALVIVRKDSGNVDAVRTRHAIVIGNFVSSKIGKVKST